MSKDLGILVELECKDLEKGDIQEEGLYFCRRDDCRFSFKLGNYRYCGLLFDLYTAWRSK